MADCIDMNRVALCEIQHIVTVSYEINISSVVKVLLFYFLLFDICIGIFVLSRNRNSNV